MSDHPVTLDGALRRTIANVNALGDTFAQLDQSLRRSAGLDPTPKRIAVADDDMLIEAGEDGDCVPVEPTAAAPKKRGKSVTPTTARD